MMREVWKYPIPSSATFELSIPIGSDLLCLQVQNGTPCLWFEVSPKAKLEVRKFKLVATGQSFEDDCVYLGTFQSGLFVWHVYQT